MGREMLLVIDCIRTYPKSCLMMCIYQEKEQQFVLYRFSNGVREQQYILLESLYLQMPLDGIFKYIYTFIYLYVLLLIRWLRLNHVLHMILN